MPSMVILRQVTTPDPPLDLMGSRMDLAASGDLDESLDSSSSSSIAIQYSSSSSGASFDYGIFLFRREAGVDHFLGIASPADISAWPLGEPVAAGTFFRSTTVSLTFRRDVIMERAWDLLIDDIIALANALTLLSEMGTAETLTFPFVAGRGNQEGASSSSSTGSRSITLTRAALAAYPSIDPVGYRLLVTCSAVNTDPKIFLHRNDLQDLDGSVKERPIAVCSPGDLVDYPEDAARGDQFPAFFRKTTFDVVTKDIVLIESTWENIRIDTGLLVSTLRVHEDEVTSEEIERLNFDE